MDLMYMCHVNFAFCDGAQIIQPAGFTPTDTIVRTEVPAHVPRNPDYDAFLETLAQNPAAMKPSTNRIAMIPNRCFTSATPKPMRMATPPA